MTLFYYTLLKVISLTYTHGLYPKDWSERRRKIISETEDNFLIQMVWFKGMLKY